MRPQQFEFTLDLSRAGTGLQPVDRKLLADRLAPMLRGVSPGQRPTAAMRCVESVVLAIRAATDAAPKIRVPVTLLPDEVDKIRDRVETLANTAMDRDKGIWVEDHDDRGVVTGAHFESDGNHSPAAHEALSWFRRQWEWQSGFDAGKRQLTQRGGELAILPGSGYGSPRKPPKPVQVTPEPGESGPQYRKRLLDAIGA